MHIPSKTKITKKSSSRRRRKISAFNKWCTYTLTLTHTHTRLVNNENASQTYPFWLITNHNLLILLKHFVQRTENNRLTHSMRTSTNIHTLGYLSSRLIFQLSYIIRWVCVCVWMNLLQIACKSVEIWFGSHLKITSFQPKNRWIRTYLYKIWEDNDENDTTENRLFIQFDSLHLKEIYEKSAHTHTHARETKEWNKSGSYSRALASLSYSSHLHRLHYFIFNFSYATLDSFRFVWPCRCRLLFSFLLFGFQICIHRQNLE